MELSDCPICGFPSISPKGMICFGCKLEEIKKVGSNPFKAKHITPENEEQK